MIVRPAEIRRLIHRVAGDGLQVSDSAVLVLARVLEDDGARLARAAIVALQRANASRKIQGLEPLRRITDEFIEAAEATDGNP
jgi:hypothetical protein